MMGIGVIDSVASVDEINKTTYKEQSKPVVPLTEKKRQLFSAFQNANYTSPEDIKGFIQSVIQKDEVSSVSDANRVLEALEAKND